MSVPVIGSSHSLQSTPVDQNVAESTRTGTGTERLFTSGRNESEVLEFFQKLDPYLTTCLPSIAVDWFHGMTRIGSANGENPNALNIYQLKSTAWGLSLPKSIQMFSDQTIRVVIHSEDCTEAFVDNLRIETPEDLGELIEIINHATPCGGCKGFEALTKCRGAVKEGNTWFSTKCNRFVTKNRSCLHCSRRLRNALGRQLSRRKKKKMMKEKMEDEEDEDNEGNPELEEPMKQEVDVRDIIQNRLQNIWNSLGLDEEIRILRENQNLTTHAEGTSNYDEVEIEVGPHLVLNKQESEDLLDL